jgi:pimeloyl-ACP methyl ester carboxylesterase
MEVRPFRVRVPESALADLSRRLSEARLPRRGASPGWSGGMDLDDLEELLEHWRSRFDWRAVEARINALPGFHAAVEGIEIHFLHFRGEGPAPLPLVVTHGWPGSFLEMLDLAPLLASPAAHGADAGDAFDVVVPSLPGYGFSAPGPPGTSPRRIAELWTSLMDGLGYARFGLQGGDWGASVATRLALAHPDRVAGLHLNYVPGSYSPDVSGRALSDAETAFRREQAEWLDQEGGYGHIQATRPQTLACALSDSPAGLAAWIVEKFREWSDCGGDVERRFSKDSLLANVTLYWLTETVSSSIRLYAEGRADPLRFAPGERVRVPTAIARFPKEAPFPPREWVERGYDVVRWTEMPRGGHFAAMEEPELLAGDLRDFFRPLRR